jgi:hypothetical protein
MVTANMRRDRRPRQRTRINDVISAEERERWCRVETAYSGGIGVVMIVLTSGKPKDAATSTTKMQASDRPGIYEAAAVAAFAAAIFLYLVAIAPALVN